MNWSSIHAGWARAYHALVVAFLIATMAPPVWAQSKVGGVTGVTATEVRTVWTSEFGLIHPTGITFLSERGVFLVTGESRSGNALLLGTDEDSHGILRLAGLANPSNIAYNPANGIVTSFNGSFRTEWTAAALESGESRGLRAPAGFVVGAVVTNSTYDAASGDLIALTAGNEIVRVTGDKVSKTRPSSIADPELIASNPTDGQIYVLGEDKTLTAMDESSKPRTTFDLSGIGLVDPTAMVFAPTSDATDASSSQNLFIADSGGSTTSGGIVEVSLQAVTTAASVPVETATLVRSTATSGWTPGSPDPAGVAYLSSPDSLLVVDSEVDEVTGAGWHNVNLWRTTRLGAVQATGTLWGSNAAVYNGKVGFSKEPTGASYDPSSQTLFVSDDSAKKVFVMKKGPDGQFGTSDDVVTAIPASSYGSTDTEDPEFDTTTGHLFFLDGVGMEIYRIDPVDGEFGNSNDVMTHFDISHLGPKDFEGLASNSKTGTLYVGARSAKRIYEITPTGTLLREISVSGVSGLRYISGLAVAPSSDNSSLNSFYIVDRQVDNGADPAENDGRMWEVRTPDSPGGGGDPVNQAPVVDAGPDFSVTLPSTATINGTVSDDGLPSGSSVTTQWSVVTAPMGGVVTFGSPNTPSTTASFNQAGDYVLRLSASDTQLTSTDDVSVQVHPAPVEPAEFRAVSDAPVLGTVVGGLENTFAADGVTQDITEVTSSRGQRAKLEHTWTFSITTTSRLTFLLTASRTGTEGYKFAYSNNGGSSWKNMVTVQSESDYQYLLPAGVTGSVIVRVRDADRTQGDTVRDTLRIDRLLFVASP